MARYCGIDLHSHNGVISAINKQDKRLLETKGDNSPALVLNPRLDVSGICTV